MKESRRGSILAAYLKLTPVLIFLVPGMVAFALTKDRSVSTTRATPPIRRWSRRSSPRHSRHRRVRHAYRPDGVTCFQVQRVGHALYHGLLPEAAPEGSGCSQVIVGLSPRGSSCRRHFLDSGHEIAREKSVCVSAERTRGICRQAIAVSFVMGIFWKRATAPAAFWAFLVGAVGGFFRLGLDLLIGRPLTDGVGNRCLASGKVRRSFCASADPLALLCRRVADSDHPADFHHQLVYQAPGKGNGTLHCLWRDHRREGRQSRELEQVGRDPLRDYSRLVGLFYCAFW